MEIEEEVNDADAPLLNKKQSGEGSTPVTDSGPSPAAPIISKEKDDDRRVGGDESDGMNSLRKRLQAAVTTA